MAKELDKGSVFLSNLVHYRTYASTKKDGFKEDKFEMFSRVEKMHLQKYPHIEEEIHKAFDYVYGGLTLPSMRTCQFAGAPIFKENVRLYNCAFTAIKSFQSFSETLFLLCCGTGVGFSVQQCHIQKLPVIQVGYQAYHKIPDSKEGWADSLLKILFNPQIEFDYSNIRPEGALLSSGGLASGPQPLNKCHEKMRTILFNARNRQLTSVECADIICHIADCVVVGSSRRSATIAIFDWFDNDMLAYKCGEWWVNNGQRARANVSACIYRKDKNAKKAFNKVLDFCFENHTGEPGIFWTNDPEGNQGLNPCICGDTLVAVADGRNAVAIKDLVGTTYPVYAIKNGAVVIKESIKTWKTRENSEIWELTLDDDSVLRGTPDHKIMLRDGTYKELKDLTEGDSLMPFNSFIEKINYRQISTNKGAGKKQYRMIAEYHGLVKNKSNLHVHHKDFNSFNDDVNNLIILTDKEHAALHIPSMLGINNEVHRIKDREAWIQKIKKTSTGLNNGRSCKFTHEEIFQKAIEHSKKIGRNLRCYDWMPFAKANNLPTKFSEYRTKEFSSISNMLRKAAIDANVPIIEKRIIRKPRPKQAKKTPLTLEETHTNLVKAHANRKIKFREQQIKIYLDLKSNKNEEPNKAEWVQECKNNNVTFEISRISSPFRSWDELKSEASIYNHRVKSVKFIGFEDVYDMTVEDVHNFGVITSKDDDAAVVASGIFISNCAEASLRDNEFCNLTSTNVAGCRDVAEYLKAVEAATIIGTLQAGYDQFGYLNPQWYKNVNESRLLGVSMTGIAEAWDMLSPQVLAEGANIINLTNERVAKKIGINMAARKGCIKPEGTGSASLGVSSGITAHLDEYYWRRVRIDKNQVLAQYLLKMLPTAFIEQDVMNPKNLVINIPIAKPGVLTSKKESAIELLEREKRLYQYWILPSHTSGLNTHNVSITVYYKPEEKQEIKEWMWRNKDFYSGIALFPSSDTTYAQLPFESMTEQNYNEVITQLPEINLADVNYLNINEERKNEVACGGGSCEMTSL